ncbi:MAG: ATP-binding protein [Campylobacterota bacterium]|nr:ATP-binding protein [Campylobacterota bacterium]
MIQAGKPILNEFLGRKKQRDELNLMLRLGQSVVLYAPRRHGKTSLINRVLADLDDGTLCISIDIMSIPNKRVLSEVIIDKCYELLGIKGFALNSLRGIGKTIKDITNFIASYGLKVEDFELSTSEKLLKDSDEEELFAHALSLPQIIASKLNKKLIFAIDELGEIRDFKDYHFILKQMRTSFQHQEDVIYLFAGSQHSVIGSIFRDSSSAFYKFAQMIELKPMKANDFEEYFNSLFSNYEIKLCESFTKEVVKIGNGIPYYIIKIANNILFNALLSKQNYINKFSILKATLGVYKSEEQYFQIELAKFRGKRYQQKLLTAFAFDYSSKEASQYASLEYSNSQREIKVLLNSGILSKSTHGKYYITDPFLEIYLKKSR